MPSSASQIVDVALGAVIAPPTPSDRQAAGPRVLIARRPAGRVYADYWELPGGKCEPGETPADCVVRELAEELALPVIPTEPLAVVEHVYDHAHVRLHPWLCTPHTAAPARPLDAAELRWVPPHTLGDYAFPEANTPILDELIQRLSSSDSFSGRAE